MILHVIIFYHQKLAPRCAIAWFAAQCNITVQNSYVETVVIASCAPFQVLLPALLAFLVQPASGSRNGPFALLCYIRPSFQAFLQLAWKLVQNGSVGQFMKVWACIDESDTACYLPMGLQQLQFTTWSDHELSCCMQYANATSRSPPWQCCSTQEQRGRGGGVEWKGDQGWRGVG